MGPLRVPLGLHPIMKMKKLKNIWPCHWKSRFFNIFLFLPKKKKGHFTHFQINFILPKNRKKNQINPFLDRSRLGHCKNSTNFKNKFLKSRFWDVQKWVIFKKRNFIFSRKKSKFLQFFNQNFENEKIGNKIKKTHFWLDRVSDTTKTVQNIKKTNKKVDFLKF